MTDQQHPITPPNELRKQWISEGRYCSSTDYAIIKASRWGYEQRGAVNEAELQKARDEELEACCEWLDFHYPYVGITQLRAARRPKPPSLKEQSLMPPADDPRLENCSKAVLHRAGQIDKTLAVNVYGPHEPDTCASSWFTSKLIASLEERILALESLPDSHKL